ncbi:flagellar basal body rod protein FlgG [Bacillus sp. ISL-47]|uniref:flagellar basal body rod protein FlgG n=1 Tax=Bacillus sp. ISL-47 TaxID=2819130 RepID=UPI001BEC8243|nr:flagellar basal body rod protein FlgG [Bacillus sp. ISL-47]MBT2688563.1 flagellar basal body rod protein FlgG [Bacillus sp. ISL-47]MBT2708861.1 flagellar basal body rod protein FlgG [Pseudomonas sp. ISL-84]
MLRSMYSGISGMKNFQTKLDVIGNNIANVNTFGYKKGRVTFQDMVSQSISGASAPTTVAPLKGGVNPKQVGLGSQLSTIDTIHTQGSLQTTGRSLDLAISGDGFFEVANGSGGLIVGSTYTRSGNFYLDSGGDIVNAEGKYLVGVKTIVNGVVTETEAPINIPTDSKSFSIGSDGTISYVDKDGELQTAGQIAITKFSNTGGLEKVGSNNYQETTNSGEPLKGIAEGDTGAGSIVAGALEMSNVDLSEEFTEMITAQRGFQANTRIITTSDEILQELVNLKR